jgi:outer membrane protein assembly factor BamB
MRLNQFMQTTLSAVIAGLFTVMAFTLSAQNPDVSITPSSVPEAVWFSPDDQYLIIEGGRNFEVYESATGKAVIRTQETAPKHSFKENGCLLFPGEQVFLVIGHELTDAHVRAFDLGTGELLWQSENLSLGGGWADIMVAVASLAAVADPMTQRAAGAYNSNVAGMFVSNKNLDNYINHIPELGSIAMNGKKGLQLIDLRTGEVRWTQESVAVALGEVVYDAKNDLLVCIIIHSNEMQRLFGKPEIVALNATTGAEAWRTDYSGNFRPNSTFLIGETLVLNFFGISVFDTATGARKAGEVTECYKRAEMQNKVLNAMIGHHTEGQGLTTITSPPLVDDAGHVYYVVGVNGNGSRADPVGGSTKSLQKIDPATGNFVFQGLEAGKKSDNPMQAYLNNGVYYVKMTNKNRSSIVGMSAENGSLLFRTDAIKNRFGTSFDNFYHQGNTLLDISATALLFYDDRTGAIIKEVPFKELGIGRLENFSPYDNGFVIFGADGTAFVDGSGKLMKSIPMNDIRQVQAGDGDIRLVDTQRFVRLSSSELKELAVLNHSHPRSVILSPRATAVAHLNAGAVDVRLMK